MLLHCWPKSPVHPFEGPRQDQVRTTETWESGTQNRRPLETRSLEELLPPGLWRADLLGPDCHLPAGWRAVNGIDVDVIATLTEFPAWGGSSSAQCHRGSQHTINSANTQHFHTSGTTKFTLLPGARRSTWVFHLGEFVCFSRFKLICMINM